MSNESTEAINKIIEPILDETGYVCGYDLTDVTLTGDNAEVQGSDLFIPGSKWKDKESLYNSVKLYLSKTGRMISRNRQTFHCNRCGKPRVRIKDGESLHKKRNLKGGDLQIGCTWIVCFKALAYSIDKNSVSRPCFDIDSPVVISNKTCCVHCSECEETMQTQEFVRSRSGMHAKCIDQEPLCDLCLFKLDHGRLSSTKIRETLMRIYPDRKNVTPQDVFSVKLKVNRITPAMTNNSSFTAFKEAVTTCSITPGINTPIEVTDDEALSCVNETWEDILNKGSNNNDSIVTVEEYFKLLSHRKGFSFQIFKDSQGYCTGAAWMTSMMRSNFERFGHCVCLDMMKRGVNKFLWPYLAVTMINDLNNVCIACEAVMMGERIEAHRAVIDFLFQNATKRTRDEVYVLCGDGFFEKSIAEDFNMTNAKFIIDYYHIFSNVLPDAFGTYYDSVEGHLRRMVDSESESDFHLNLKQAKAKILDINNGNEDANIIHILNDFAGNKAFYARFMLKTCKGTMGKRSSTPAEANHSSVLCYLNDGVKGRNGHCEDLHALTHDLFRRQKFHLNKWNSQLQNEHNKLECEKRTLQQMDAIQDPSTPSNMLISAIEYLSHLSHNRFKADLKSAMHLVHEEKTDFTSGQKHHEIRDTRHPESQPRMFKSINDRCNCERAASFMSQCRHEIRLHHKFIASYFHVCHHRRRRVQGSLVGWQPVIDDTCEELLDFQTQDSLSAFDHAENTNENDFITGSTINESNLDPLHLHPSALKPISQPTLIKMCNNVTNNYCKLTDDTKFAISAAIVALEQLSCHGSLDNPTLSEECVDSQNLIQKHMKDVVTSYKSAFKSNLQQTFQDSSLTSTKINKPSHSLVIQQSQKRLRSRREKNASRCITNFKNVPKLQKIDANTLDTSDNHQVRKNARCDVTCSFCSQSGHKITSCAIMNNYKTKWKLTSSDMDRDDLIHRLCNNVGNENSGEKSFVTKLHLSKNNMPFVIHKVFMKNNAKQGTVSMSSLNILVSFIGNGGEIMEVDKEVLVDGKEIERLIITAKSKRKKHYIFDATIQEISNKRSFTDLRQNEHELFTNNIPNNGNYLMQPNMTNGHMNSWNGFINFD